MKLVVGLGNPGARYAETRHNIGFLVVDELLRGAREPVSFTSRFGGDFAPVDLERQRVGLLKPQTFMNRSGTSVSPAMSSLELDVSDLVVIHDDLDLAFGTVRVKVGGGSGGHRGLESCFEELETRDFTRVRVGIDRPDPGREATAHVLEGFDERQRGELGDVVNLAAEAAREIIRVGATVAMNRFNRRTIAPNGGEP